MSGLSSTRRSRREAAVDGDFPRRPYYRPLPRPGGPSAMETPPAPVLPTVCRSPGRLSMGDSPHSPDPVHRQPASSGQGKPETSPAARTVRHHQIAIMSASPQRDPAQLQTKTPQFPPLGLIRPLQPMKPSSQNYPPGPPQQTPSLLPRLHPPPPVPPAH